MTHRNPIHSMLPAAAQGSRSPLNRTPPVAQHDQLEQQAQKWVAQTFFGTLLKQMHESPFKSNLLDGGRGGQAFAPLYDQQLAEKMSHAAGRKLVSAIVRQIEAKSAYSKTASSGKSAAGADEGDANHKPLHGANPLLNRRSHGAQRTAVPRLAAALRA